MNTRSMLGKVKNPEVSGFPIDQKGRNQCFSERGIKGNKESSIGDQEKLGVVDHTRSFLKRQKTNFKLMVARDSLLLVSGRKSEARIRSLGGYEWIYLERLGATSLQIGSVNGVLSFLSVALSVPAGWLIDRVKNIKNLYLISSLLGVPAVLLLVYANDWIGFLLIMMWYTIAASIQLPSKLIVDIDSLNDNDRVAGLSIHRTITALAGVAPLLMIAYVIDRFGGIDTARGLRPVF